VVSVATTVVPSLLIVILHTFQNPSITAFKVKQMLSPRTKSEGDTISGAGDYDLKYAIKR